MNMPGFTAGASLYKRKGHYQRRTTRVGPRGNNEVIAQAAVGEEAAQLILKVVKAGAVHCDWVEYCEGHMPNIHCGIRKMCYWWPY